MYTLSEFLDSELSLIIFEDERELYRSSASDLKPLVEYLGMKINTTGNTTVFDRYIGRAAALLISTLKPRKVYTGVVSESGAEALREAGIEFEAREKAKYLMSVASEDMCRWEKMAVGKTAKELLAELAALRER